MEKNNVSSEDHDLLIRVDENVRSLTTIVSDKFTDHEARLRSTEKDMNYAKGGLRVTYAILTLLAAFVAALWWVKG